MHGNRGSLVERWWKRGQRHVELKGHVRDVPCKHTDTGNRVITRQAVWARGSHVTQRGKKKRGLYSWRCQCVFSLVEKWTVNHKTPDSSCPQRTSGSKRALSGRQYWPEEMEIFDMWCEKRQASQVRLMSLDFGMELLRSLHDIVLGLYGFISFLQKSVHD